MRAAIYARVSTIDQSPDLQLRELRQYAASRGWLICQEYVDQVTGKRDRKEAPAYSALMQAAARRSFDCVIVWKYDRFARSLSLLVSALHQFHSLGIEFISYTQNIDTTTPMGRLFFHVIGSFAEFERDLIVDRVRAGIANARAKGVKLGRPVRDPTASDRIKELRNQGLSLREIARRESRSPAGVLKILREGK